MALEEKCLRVLDAVKSLSVSIRGKGVSVPDGTGIEAFPALVDSISMGVDTSDATATANDIVSNKTAYADGDKITGNIPLMIDLRHENAAPTFSASKIAVSCDIGARTLFDAGAKITIRSDAAQYGDATAADVAAGKTFTSAAGLLSVGTAQLGNDGGSGGGSNLPDTIVAGDTPVMACFEGEMVSVLSPKKTSLTLTIPRAGTYRFKVPTDRSGSGTPTVYLHKGDAEVSQLAINSNGSVLFSTDVSCSVGDVITVYAKAVTTSFGSTSYTTNITCHALIACINWDNDI